MESVRKSFTNLQFCEIPLSLIDVAFYSDHKTFLLSMATYACFFLSLRGCLILLFQSTSSIRFLPNAVSYSWSTATFLILTLRFINQDWFLFELFVKFFMTSQNWPFFWWFCNVESCHELISQYCDFICFICLHDWDLKCLLWLIIQAKAHFISEL